MIPIGFSLFFGSMAIIHISEAFGQSVSIVKIAKNLTNSYTISSGSSNIGSFGANYTILGNIDTLKKRTKVNSNNN